jgi:hypothetical protein
LWFNTARHVVPHLWWGKPKSDRHLIPTIHARLQIKQQRTASERDPRTASTIKQLVVVPKIEELELLHHPGEHVFDRGPFTIQTLVDLRLPWQQNSTPDPAHYRLRNGVDTITITRVPYTTEK